MTAQPTLFDAPETFKKASFDGSTYDKGRDQVRLSAQLQAVFDVMGDGRWRTLSNLAFRAAQITGKRVSEQSASARLRDLRKERFGAHNIERRSLGGGLFEYRLKA